MEYKALRVSAEGNFSARFTAENGVVTKTTPAVELYNGRDVGTMLAHMRRMNARVWARVKPGEPWFRVRPRGMY